MEPSTETLLNEYTVSGGRINENLSDLYPFYDNIRNHDLNSRSSNVDYLSAFNLMLSGDTMAILNIIRSHYNVVKDISEIR